MSDQQLTVSKLTLEQKILVLDAFCAIAGDLVTIPNKRDAMLVYAKLTTSVEDYRRLSILFNFLTQAAEELAGEGDLSSVTIAEQRLSEAQIDALYPAFIPTALRLFNKAAVSPQISRPLVDLSPEETKPVDSQPKPPVVAKGRDAAVAPECSKPMPPAAYPADAKARASRFACG